MNKIKSTGLSGRTTKVKNAAGGKAYTLPTKERLVTGVLTSFFKEPKHYGDTSKELVNAARELIKTEPEFVAKLAVFTRKEFHIRTISQVLAAEVAKGAKGNQIVRRMTRKVIERPDDMTNILAYYFETFGARKSKDGKEANPVSRSLRRGLADAFPKFEEYHLAKYKSEGSLVKLRDVLLICRPKPSNPEQAALWKRLIEGTLKTPETRETILSEQGQSKEVWESFIDSGKLGFMAMLRNLGNFMKNKVDNLHLDKVIARLKNRKQVLESKQLPFRFFSAFKFIADEHPNHPRVKGLVKALDEALAISVENMPKLHGVTFMTADESGSMRTPISEKSKVHMKEVGNLMMAIADGFCDKAVVTVFGDKTAEVKLAKDDTIIEKMNKINRVGDSVGMSTLMSTSIDFLIEKGIKVDRIIVFSDMQAYDNSSVYRADVQSQVEAKLDKYRKDVNPDVWVHSIDLSGQGTVQTKGPKTNLIAGWSEKVFDFIALSESSGGSLIDKIENYEI